jgi:LPXTG-motif cell wall-anchored protein
MKNLLLVVGLITLLVGIWFAYQYLYTTGEKTSIYIAAAAFVVSLASLGYFFFLRFREEGEQDISITKF